MTIANIKSKIGDFSKDARINFPKIFTEDGSKDLSLTQIFSIALSIGYSLRNKDLVASIQEDGAEHLDDAHITAAKSAASIMAMNNVYYRFIHLVGDADYGRMPAGLRMQVIMNSGIDKLTFELMSLAVSSINGCGMCNHITQRHLKKKVYQRPLFNHLLKLQQSCLRLIKRLQLVI